MTKAFRIERRLRSHGFRAVAHPYDDYLIVCHADGQMPGLDAVREVLPDLPREAFTSNRTTRRVFVQID